MFGVMMLIILASLASFFFLAERLFALRPQKFLRSGFFTDVLYVPVHLFLRVFINGTVAVGVTTLGQQFLPGYSVHVLRDQPIWIQATVLVLVLDFIFYVTHRLKHRWHWWWRLHETHHSSIDVDWLSAARFHPLEKILDRTIYLFPLLIFGASEASLLIWATVDAFFGMFIHSNVRFRIGPLIYIFMGPEMHRWHHALDPERRDCNYGNNFSIFDWIFGTAYLVDENPSEFGVDASDYPQGNILRQFFFAFRR